MVDYSSTRALQRHQRKPFTVGGVEVKHQRCDICPNADGTYNFFDEEALLTHCKAIHLACKLCKQGSAFFLDEKSLQKHLLSVHNGQADDASKAIDFAFLANSTKFLNANTICNVKMVDQFAMPTESLTKANGNFCAPQWSLQSQFGDSGFTESESDLSLVNSGDDTVDKPSLPLTKFSEMSLHCDGGFMSTLPIGRGRPRNFK